ncbi:MAG: hypothetical protein Q8R78_04975, partial [Candidatus Omnitrophota bacterium]|nr:hypothetical protein [Candidatus Omnitrophota bacterium]
MSYASAFLLLVLLLLIGSRVEGEHIAWMAPFRDAEGTSCCEKTDCQVREILVLNAGRGMLVVDEIPLSVPPGSLHR